jgi:hypothetical protein
MKPGNLVDDDHGRTFAAPIDPSGRSAKVKVERFKIPRKISVHGKTRFSR